MLKRIKMSDLLGTIVEIILKCFQIKINSLSQLPVWSPFWVHQTTLV